MEKTLIIIENKENSLEHKNRNSQQMPRHRDKELRESVFFKIQITLIRQLYPENTQTEHILEYSAVENRPH